MKREQDKLAVAMMAPEEMLAHLPAVRLGPEDVELIRHGRPVEAGIVDPGMPVRICDQRGCLIAVGSHEAGSRLLRPRIVLAEGG
jgi:tRNA U55 pseudouridine synthase TruB